MTLDISLPSTFKRTVRIRRPNGEGFEDESFSVTFRLLDVEEVGGHDVSTPEGAGAVLVAAIIDLADIKDATGPLAYDEMLRDRVLSVPYLRTALIHCYLHGASEIAIANADAVERVLNRRQGSQTPGMVHETSSTQRTPAGLQKPPQRLLS